MGSDSDELPKVVVDMALETRAHLEHLYEVIRASTERRKEYEAAVNALVNRVQHYPELRELVTRVRNAAK